MHLGGGLELGAEKAVFGLYRDVDSQGNGRLCSTISYGYDREGKSKKYFQAGLPRGLAVLHESGQPEEVVITESPVDALSYKQQHGNANALYVSTCGSLTKDVKEELAGVLKSAQAHRQSVVLAFDRDEAGVKMNRAVEALCQGASAQYIIINTTTGEVDEDVLLTGKRKYVDGEDFVKIFVKEMEAIFDLSKSSQKVFTYILSKIKYDEHFIFNMEECLEKTSYKSRTPIFNSLVELIQKEFIAKTKN